MVKMTNEEYLIGLLRGFTCTDDERKELLFELDLHGCICVYAEYETECYTVLREIVVNDDVYKAGDIISAWTSWDSFDSYAYR